MFNKAENIFRQAIPTSNETYLGWLITSIIYDDTAITIIAALQLVIDATDSNQIALTEGV
jgi:hypothetical protein